MAYIRQLKLHCFRSFKQAEILGLEPGFVVFYGLNGAGKTNILEAVSLVSPGRGIRSAKISHFQNHDMHEPWAVSIKLQTDCEEVRIGTGRDTKSNTEKRLVRINGQPSKGQTQLLNYITCVWITPQMDRLFLDSVRERRRFLDRLVFGFDPGHLGRITRYENALSQRSKILRDGQNEDRWLSGLEQQMAETGVAIAAARLEFIERLQKAYKGVNHEHFPSAKLHVEGLLESLLTKHKALEVEDRFRDALLNSRNKDSIVGGADQGPHKSDMVVVYEEKNMPADQCSTGEQKILLMGLVLAQSLLIKAERGVPPLMLLDEVAAHLDDQRRAGLYEILEALDTQIWLTGTDDRLFEDLQNRARFYHVQNSLIEARS